MSRKTPIQRMADAQADYKTYLYKEGLKRLKKGPKGKYDAVNGNADKKRRKSLPEMENEDKILRPYDRLKIINLARDLERNSTAAKGILKQFKINVVGTLGKLQFNSVDENTNETVNRWFNKIYAPHCDSRTDLHFSEQLQLDVAGLIREGDEVIAFDDFDREDGKLLRWEADQMVEMNPVEWKTFAVSKDSIYFEEGKDKKGKKTKIPMKQSSGVIYDSRGRVHGYMVTCKRGLITAKRADITILPISVAKLVKNPFRHNQLRGTGDFFALIADVEDIYEMRAKELQSAKKAADTAVVVTKTDAPEEGLLRGGIGPEALLATADGTDETTTAVETHEALEALTGGKTAYALPGESVDVLDAKNRPNVHMKEFFDFVLEGAGAGVGMAKAYTRLVADKSYTAFRGEMLMTWATFYDWQKYIERHICDWVAIKAIKWAVDNGELKVKLPDMWETMISWIFPVMPQIDPGKEGDAIDSAIKNGRTDFGQVLGPDWKKKLVKSGEGLKWAKKQEIPLSAFETKSGGVTEETNGDEDE